MAFSDNLKKYRLKKALSQHKLAKLSGVTHICIVKLEAGERKNPSMETLLKLSNALEMSIDELVGRTFKKKKS